MTDDEDALSQLFSETLVTAAFRLEIALTLARSQPDPVEWAKKFISTLHARLDANEKRIGASDALHAHERARGKIDGLAAELLKPLQPPLPQSGNSR